MDTLDASGLTFLERMSLVPGSLELYRDIYADFRARCRRDRLPTRTVAQLDRSVVATLHEMFKEGELSSESQKQVSTIQ